MRAGVPDTAMPSALIFLVPCVVVPRRKAKRIALLLFPLSFSFFISSVHPSIHPHPTTPNHPLAHLNPLPPPPTLIIITMTKLASVYKTDYVQTLDQHSQTNLNSSWVNAKGTHTIAVFVRVAIRLDSVQQTIPTMVATALFRARLPRQLCKTPSPCNTNTNDPVRVGLAANERRDREEAQHTVILSCFASVRQQLKRIQQAPSTSQNATHFCQEKKHRQTDRLLFCYC